MKKIFAMILLFIIILLCGCNSSLHGLDVNCKMDVNKEIIFYDCKTHNNVHEITVYSKYNETTIKETFVFKGEYNNTLIYYECKTYK